MVHKLIEILATKREGVFETRSPKREVLVMHSVLAVQYYAVAGA